MKPITARAVMTSITLVVVIAGTVFVNSVFHGSFVVGLVVIVLPFLILGFTLPYLLPVRCPPCGGKMRFHFVRPTSSKASEAARFAYVCLRCDERHEWEGASGGSSFD
jgi:hypothetical protein